MKTKRLFITVIMIIAGGFFMNISAQEALKALAKKCETLENVEISVVKNKKMNSFMMRIVFTNNESLKNEILAAFKKDREGADHIAENKSSQNVRLTYRFENIVYTFSLLGNRCTFSVSENNEGNVGALLDDFIPNHGMSITYENNRLQPKFIVDTSKQKLDSVKLKILNNVSISLGNPVNSPD